MLAIAWLSSLGPRQILPQSGTTKAPVFATVQDIIISRCSMCHAKEVVWGTLATAGNTIRLDDADHIRRYASLIEITAVRSNAIRLGTSPK
jgi:uncharacterized membrane protein